MRVITYATDHQNPYLSHLVNKLEAEVLPEYLPWSFDFFPRAFSIHATVSRASEDGLFLCTDAYDVLALNKCNKENLEKKIKKHFDLDKVTFCAETNCFPDQSLAEMYPNCYSDWKYLNAGLFVGRASVIKKMLELTMCDIVNSMDQLEFSKLFLESNLINLDVECKVFQTLFRKEYGRQICWEDFEIKNKKIMNRKFETFPLLFHGNGMVDMNGLLKYI